MEKVWNDFVSAEPRRFPFKLGTRIASGLSGFIAGIVTMGIVWVAVEWVMRIARHR